MRFDSEWYAGFRRLASMGGALDGGGSVCFSAGSLRQVQLLHCNPLVNNVFVNCRRSGSPKKSVAGTISTVVGVKIPQQIHERIRVC